MNIKWYIIILITFIGVSSLFPQSIIINEVMSSNQSTITDEDGDYSDWIEIFNSADNQINLSQFSLSDDINIKNKWTFPDINLNPKSYLLIFASGKNRIGNYLHTNFKISSDGEKLWLNDSSGIAIDELDSILIPTDLSIGRNISNPSDWLFYKNPTPGSENNQNGFSAICKIPVFTLEAGFYGNTINLEITKENANENIYYTTDGSTPTLNSVKYSSAIMISKTTVIKAKCFGDGLLSSKIVTKTYFVNEEFTLPVVSLSTDPNNFWDEQNGIYVDGTNGISGPCSAEPKNYNQDWEKPLNFEFF